MCEQAATDTIFLIPNVTAADASAGGTLAVIAPRLKTLISIRGAAEDPAGGSDGAARNITLRGLSFAHSAPSCEPPQARPHPSDLRRLLLGKCASSSRSDCSRCWQTSSRMSCRRRATGPCIAAVRS